MSCVYSFSIDLAVGVCPGGGSGRHGAEEHHRVLPAVERDGLRDAWDARGRLGIQLIAHSLPLSLNLSLSLSPTLSVSVSPGEKLLKRWRFVRKGGCRKCSEKREVRCTGALNENGASSTPTQED